jgi:protein-S-isoprenylcysteine O-methyltransferase Ste14
MNPVRSLWRAFNRSSGTFRAELVATSFVAVFFTTHAERIADHLAELIVPLSLVAACYVAKIGLMAHLARQGGEAWDYGHSRKLVTGGIYRLTRNPVYTIVLLQFGLWTAIVSLCGGGAGGGSGERLAAYAWTTGAAMLLVGMWQYFSRVAVPREERTLRADHGADFRAYCERVPRWGMRRLPRGAFEALCATAPEDVPAE